jgi:hypothetical protein
MTKEAPASSDALFADLPPVPEEHFKIYFFGTVLGLIAKTAACLESFDQVMERFPFLAGYLDQVADRLNGLSIEEALTCWWASLDPWEENAGDHHLPLAALRDAAGLGHSSVLWLITIGLVEEDARFGTVFQVLQGTPQQRRPTVGLLNHWWRDEDGGEGMLVTVRQLQNLGLMEVLNEEDLRSEWQLRVPGPVWDALRGPVHFLSNEWARYRPPSELLSLNELITSPEADRVLRALPRLLQSREVRVAVIRGPSHNGRHTALGAVARAMGCGILEISGLEKASDARWRQAGALALLLHALPVVAFEPGPGEAAPVPDLEPESVAFGVVLGNQGGLSGRLTSQAITLEIKMPGLEARRRHWAHYLSGEEEVAGQEVSNAFRLTSGTIYRAARLARTYANVAGRARVEPHDVLEATRALNRQAFDNLAHHIPVAGSWNHLCVGEHTMAELQHLESRCRYREQLPDACGGAQSASMNCGVRALFSGPSGTGKTLAARVLASSLQKDLYQVDLSAVVNKYIGETEKNLNRVFERAEELDVILLLDEGDALLAPRTDVSSANDRYANLETNFLLQRIESFQGVVIVTTNARKGIDSAFERRMDLVVEFYLPNAEDRWRLWQVHLPPACAVDEMFLAEIAGRCELSGSQIRNAALHASLLALSDGGVISAAYVESAVRREYKKQGASCPLRPKTCKN